MTINPQLRGHIENQIDNFIKNPNQYINIGKLTPISNKNPVDFVLGFLYGQILMTISLFYTTSNIKQEDTDLTETVKILNRRSLEIIDVIQRELEKK
jgi:hypothetical protein